MPYVTAAVNSRLNAEQMQALSEALIRLLADDLGKDRDLSVMRIVNQPGSFRLAQDGAPPGLAAVEVHVTAGTTTAEQRAAFITHAQTALETLGLGVVPSYVIIHEHHAEAWGFGGKTQATRRATAPAEPATD